MMNRIRYILCDVEGTTTDIRFVHNELFPFAREKLREFFDAHPQEKVRSAQALGCMLEAVIEVLRGFIDNDVKNAELKRIQGKIWAGGYAKGLLKGHVYEDVLPAFSRWNAQGKVIGIYSSGSVQAQKLIYGNSIAGDLCVFIDDHFDLKQGYKYEPQSYHNIVEELGIHSDQILFLSDVEAELDAAQQIGIQTMRLFRGVVEETKHAWAADFHAIFP